MIVWLVCVMFVVLFDMAKVRKKLEGAKGGPEGYKRSIP